MFGIHFKYHNQLIAFLRGSFLWMFLFIIYPINQLFHESLSNKPDFKNFFHSDMYYFRCYPIFFNIALYPYVFLSLSFCLFLPPLSSFYLTHHDTQKIWSTCGEQALTFIMFDSLLGVKLNFKKMPTSVSLSLCIYVCLSICLSSNGSTLIS